MGRFLIKQSKESFIFYLAAPDIKNTHKLDREHTASNILSIYAQPDKQEGSEFTRHRHIKVSVGLKQDVPVFLASMWNSVSSCTGPWLLSSANGELVQADKAERICSTFHRPFKKTQRISECQVVGEATGTPIPLWSKGSYSMQVSSWAWNQLQWSHVARGLVHQQFRLVVCQLQWTSEHVSVLSASSGQ